MRKQDGIVWLGVGAAVIAAAVLVALPILPLPVVEGELTGFRHQSTETGVESFAEVRVDGKTLEVRLPATHDCRLTDQVTVYRKFALIGTRSTLGGCTGRR